MDAQDFRRIQEAYREVYQELDEADDLESLQKDTQSSVDRMKKGNRITRAGAHIAAHKVARDVKKASAYGPQRPKAGQTGAYRINNEEYNYILSHLIDEGYTNTLNGAEVIASNMSEEWIVSILDEEITPERRAQYKRGLKVRQTNQETAGKSRPRKRATSPQPGAQHQRKGMTQSHRDTMRDVAREENPERPEGSGSLPKGKKLERQRKTGVSAE